MAVLALLLVASPQQAQAKPKPKPPNSISLVPIIKTISIVDGQLIAEGTVNAIIHHKVITTHFTAPVDIRLAPHQVGLICPVLDLSLGPINLDLLGLVVETSPICLQLTAFENGGLLGDLLCTVGNLLNGGLSLDQILAGQGLPLVPGLTPGQLTNLLGGLTDLLNGALGRLINAVLTAILHGGGAACDILHLELGPVNLNLLGLEVDLDNCSNGAITVDITAEPGHGNLLGNLLCSLLGDGLISLGTTLQGLLNLLLAALS